MECLKNDNKVFCGPNFGWIIGLEKDWRAGKWEGDRPKKKKDGGGGVNAQFRIVKKMVKPRWEPGGVWGQGTERHREKGVSGGRGDREAPSVDWGKQREKRDPMEGKVEKGNLWTVHMVRLQRNQKKRRGRGKKRFSNEAPKATHKQ